MSEQQPGGRRSTRAARRRVELTGVLAVVLPLLTAAAVVLVRPADHPTSTQPPTSSPLQAASVLCPAALRGSPEVRLTRVGRDAAGATGEVSVGLGERRDPVDAAAGRITTVEDDGRLVVAGSGDLAPGLVAARFRTAPLAAVDCPPTAADQWFTGAGAAATHDSVLELVNPNAGVAVADVTVLAGAGPVQVPALRGVAVPGRSGVRLDLGQVVPRRGDLALRVTTARGQLSATLLDRYDELGAVDPATDWLAAQDAPATDVTMLGVPGGQGTHTLVIGNPGPDQVRATVRFVTADSVFTPESVEPVSLAPESTSKVTLSEALAAAVADGVIGVRVEAAAPVTATLRSFVRGDLSLATPGRPVEDATAVVVPPGDKRLLLAGATGVGVAEVVASDAEGRELARERVALRPGAGASVELPADAVLVGVTPARTAVSGAVLVTATGRRPGATAVPLRPLVRTGLVPAVRPGTP